MRQIRFRGKRSLTGEWIYGDLVRREGHFYIIRFDQESPFPLDLKGYEVEEDSIGQLTCLTDRNGTEIYEGDILKSRICSGDALGDEKFAEINIHYVKYERAMAAFVIVSISNNGIRKGEIGTLWQPKENIEVIGNIYDNPDLLKD
jgi:uncharacterized phage protein (TIGR01671 family)